MDVIAGARFVAASIVLLLAALIAIMNWGCVIASAWYRRKGIDRTYSTIPLVSLILAYMADIVYPFTPKWWIAIIPALDVGTWVVIVGIPWGVIQSVRAAHRR